MKKELTQEQKERYRAKAREYKKNNADKIKEQRKDYDKQYYKSLSDEQKVKRKDQQANKKNQNRKVRQLLTDEEKKLRRSETKKKYCEKNKEKIAQYNKQYAATYYEKNKEILSLKIYKREKERMKSDHLFKITKSIKSLIRSGINSRGYTKKSRTFEILGCSFEEFKVHLESKFEPWMTWDNYGKYKKDTYNYGWDIDHIVPVSSAQNEEGVIALNHYTNLQPLCSKVNRDIKKANQ